MGQDTALESNMTVKNNRSKKKDWIRGKRPRHKGFSVPLPLWIGAAFLIGMAGSVFLIRQRNRTQMQEMAVRVSGLTVPKQEFYDRLEQTAGVPIIRKLVSEELQLQYAKEKGFLPAESEVEASFAKSSKQPDFMKKLDQIGQTPEDVRRMIRIQLCQENALKQGMTVTDADVQSFYRKNSDPKNVSARYYTPETIKIAVIVTKTQADGQKALSALRSGTPFIEVAKDFSQDDSRKRGGVLAPFQRGRMMSAKIPGLEATIFAMHPGQEIGPRAFAGAWWIIHCLDKVPASTVPFDKVKEECKSGALMVKGLALNARKMQTDFEAFQKKANVQAFWTQYKKALE